MNAKTSNRIRILIAVIVLALATMACGINVPAAQQHYQTGPSQTTNISVPMPADTSAPANLTLQFLAGEMKLSPGASGALASGAATYNVAEFKPVVEGSGSAYKICMTQCRENIDIKTISSFNKEVVNRWDVQLANTPMNLNIEAGAYSGNFELGGLSLQSLTISEGGSDLTGSFSQPNNVEMKSLTFNTGGSRTSLKGLANANFDQMTFSSGAGDYTLSFDGKLQRDGNVTVESGASTVTIIVPQGVNAKLTFEGGMTGINISGGWSKNDNVYTQSGSGPTLTIVVKMGVGSLNLKNS